jgi:hypothetical protein
VATCADGRVFAGSVVVGADGLRFGLRSILLTKT